MCEVAQDCGDGDAASGVALPAEGVEAMLQRVPRRLEEDVPVAAEGGRALCSRVAERVERQMQGRRGGGGLCCGCRESEWALKRLLGWVLSRAN